jgi:NAD(P)-dependent dehydrogenase (short-subunit alcohol dehydrogenase family)
MEPHTRSAFVTGASSGIGLAYAEMLADEGYDLTVVARGSDRLAEAAARLRGLGVAVLEGPADLSDEDQIRQVFAAHGAAYGSIDVLVNNAGTAQLGSVADITARMIDDQLGLNVRGLMLAYREALPLLTKGASDHGQSLVFNVASVAAQRGTPMMSVYAATKAAVLNFSLSMHTELVGQGIRSTAVCPGFVDTPFTDGVKNWIPADSMIRPSDVAELSRPLLHLSPVCHVPELTIDRVAA